MRQVARQHESAQNTRYEFYMKRNTNKAASQRTMLLHSVTLTKTQIALCLIERSNTTQEQQEDEICK